MNWQQNLQQFQTHFIALAAEVGIDGQQLLQQLPQSGQLLTGRRVPVLEKKYQSTCSVLFHINHTKQGHSWVYAQFKTFKHGGMTQIFHGLNLQRQSQNTPLAAGSSHLCQTQGATTQLQQQNSAQSQGIDDQWRMQQFSKLQQQYFQGSPLTDCPWLDQRLIGYANTQLYQRLWARVNAQGQILVPMSHPQLGIVGYHQITPAHLTANKRPRESEGERDKKRHYLQKAGTMSGAAVIIQALNSHDQQVAICEGFITGLTLALVFSGTIYVALTANNLAKIRGVLPKESVTFFADNDQFKPHVGNTGVRAAQQAMQPNDRLCIPNFAPELLVEQPTDFNDLLCLAGIEALTQQICDPRLFQKPWLS